MIVIGTAGHIDHGKSSIVQRLTGTDPDRLPEEKERGMTIDLGFAFYPTPNNETIAIVDVPGHERFVKNMIAGAGGIDVAMMVIAADDGWMPQSTEHFHILRLLGIQHGIIVINKCDLVTQERVDSVASNVQYQVSRSFLANAPLFTVSAVTGKGFGDLRTYLNQLPEKITSRQDTGKPRLCIDRSFVRPGIGGVATGTLRGGSLRVGQEVTLWPSKIGAKIRTLQSNNESVEIAQQGQRTALSLSGIDKSLLERGGVISDRFDLTHLQENPVLALRVELLSNSPVSLKSHRRILLLAGTAEVEGEIRTWNNEEISQGGTGYCFFIPDSPLYTLIGDSIILRLPTPMVTVGGARVLDQITHLPRLRELPQYQYLLHRNVDDPASLVQSELQKQLIVSTTMLLSWADYSRKTIEAMVSDLKAQMVLKEHEGYLYDPVHLQARVADIRAQIEQRMQQSAHLKGVKAEQLSSVLHLDAAATFILLRILVQQSVLSGREELFSVSGTDTQLSGPLKAAYDDVISQLQTARFVPPTLSSFADKGKTYREAIRVMLESGQVHKCGTDFIFVSSAWKEITDFIREYLQSHPSLTVSDMKEKFGISRKHAIPILEETDRLQLTKRSGDVRVKGEKFEA